MGSARRLIALDSDIAEVQERWRQYRNAVKDGFFFNETMIVVSDYESDDEEGSEELTTVINDNIPTSNVDNKTMHLVQTWYPQQPESHHSSGSDNRHK